MLQNGIFRLDWTATDPCCKLITIKQSGWPRNQFVYNVYKVVENNTQKLNSLLAIQWIKKYPFKNISLKPSLAIVATWCI